MNPMQNSYENENHVKIYNLYSVAIMNNYLCKKKNSFIYLETNILQKNNSNWVRGWIFGQTWDFIYLHYTLMTTDVTDSSVSNSLDHFFYT